MSSPPPRSIAGDARWISWRFPRNGPVSEKIVRWEISMPRQADKDVRVALTFDFDACCAWIGSMGATSPSMVSRGEFGPIALRRVLALLDRYGVRATFFIP